MKLLRFGPLGQEKPGVIDADGRIRDLSGVIADIDGAALSDVSLTRLRALDLTTLPLAPEGVRYGACVGKVGKFLGNTDREKFETLQWLMFQMGGVGPMFGQYNHFAAYAPERIPYAVERYGNEVRRLHGVLEKRLAESEWLAGSGYSIADIATFPWIRNPDRRGIDLSDYPSVLRWHDAIAARPAVQRGVAVLADRSRQGAITDAERENMFGKTQFARR